MAKPRLRVKATCDLHGRPVPENLKFRARECGPLPFVVSAVESYVKVTSVSVFKQEYGNLLRRIPQYRGLKRRVLRSALVMRYAINLVTGQWARDPILVSEKVLRNWLDKYEIPAGEDDFPHVSEKQIATVNDLEAWYGDWLRRHVALGIAGRRALERYLGEPGVSVSDFAVRQWYDLQSRLTPEEVDERICDICEADDADASACRDATYADVHALKKEMRVWRHVQGLSMHQVTCHLRGHFSILQSRKGVSYLTVRDFYRRNPVRVFKHWQLLLQRPVIEYLQELKRRYNGIDHDLTITTPRGPEELWYARTEHQPFLKKRLWEEYAVSCELPARDLHNVWQHVCLDESYGANMCCTICGHIFPESNVVLQEGVAKLPSYGYANLVLQMMVFAERLL